MQALLLIILAICLLLLGAKADEQNVEELATEIKKRLK